MPATCVQRHGNAVNLFDQFRREAGTVGYSLHLPVFEEKEFVAKAQGHVQIVNAEHGCQLLRMGNGLHQPHDFQLVFQVEVADGLV